jgi:ribonuclease G
MEKKILILDENQKIWTYIIEDDQVVEIHNENKDNSMRTIHQVGNIYIGKVKKRVDNIGAAFIEIEPGLECYYHLNQADNAMFTTKVGKKSLAVADELVVQLTKEGVKGKVPTVKSDISLTGYYTVLTTGNNKVGVSKKIPKKHRMELLDILKPYENEEYGIILRTNGMNAPSHLIHDEIKELIKSYEKLKGTSSTRTCFSVLNKVTADYITNIRNVYKEGLSKIYVNNQGLYDEISDYYKGLKEIEVPIVQLKDSNTLTAMFNTRKVLENALNQRVWMKNGSYLVIQPTEALTVIDVNSGKYEKKQDDCEAAFNINLEAAKQVAKQLRLRNISGIIIVDFINMNQKEDIDMLLKELRRYLAKDSVQITLVGVTKLQLVEITRKKIRKSLLETLTLGEDRV